MNFCALVFTFAYIFYASINSIMTNLPENTGHKELPKVGSSPLDLLQRHIVLKKIYFYSGPNYYLDRAAMVFNISFSPILRGYDLGQLKETISARFPAIKTKEIDELPELFAETLLQVLKLDLDLHIYLYDVLVDNEEYSIAIEYLDDFVAEKALFFLADWFDAMLNPKVRFNFGGKFRKLQEDFDKGVFGGPTIYSLIEAGMKRKIPVNYLKIEGQFQWGYGKRSIRGKSTVLDVDGVKDTEFTQYKDACKDFLLVCGFPAPKGETCFTEEEVLDAVENVGFPLVIKPVAGHKGQGVTTGISDIEGAKRAFKIVVALGKEQEGGFQGAIVETHVEGNDHRLLAIGGKFSAALEREPAFVIGDGIHTIGQLIQIENDTNPNRSNHLRAPLARIVVDEDMTNYLGLQNLSLNTKAPDGEKVYLRRVANISAGGLSCNVTDVVHPDNIRLVEDIASFFRVTAFAIDVLTSDISKSWREGNFGIIEINAGPGIFMHLAPAIGQPVDVPGQLMEHFFPTPDHARIPIVVGNAITNEIAEAIRAKAIELFPKLRYFGSLITEGIFINGHFFTKHAEHDTNVAILLRHIGLDIALFNHHKEAIHDYGIYHSGADIAILDNPNYAERTLESELLPHGFVLEVYPDKIEVLDKEKSLAIFPITDPANKLEVMMQAITPCLKEIIARYENR